MQKALHQHTSVCKPVANLAKRLSPLLKNGTSLMLHVVTVENKVYLQVNGGKLEFLGSKFDISPNKHL